MSPVLAVSRHRQQSLGVIGLGPDWESTYGPALERLGDRVRIGTACGPVLKTSAALAEAGGAQHQSGIRSLLRLTSDGVLAIAPDCYGWYPVEAAVAAGRNVYAALPDQLDAAQLGRLQRTAVANGLLLMPELRLRYTPATLRLRELLATDLGPIELVHIRTLSRNTPSSRRLLRELLDWCRTVAGTAPTTIQATEENGSSTRQQVVALRFPGVAGQYGDFSATLNVPTAEAGGSNPKTPADVWPVEFTLKCKYGEARLEDAVHLRWRTSGQERIESLSTERTAVSVALDHFARRLAGGLVPVPTLADLLVVEHWVTLTAQSLAQGGVALATRPTTTPAG